MKQPKILILIAAAAAVILLGITSCEVLGDIISKPTARVDSVEIIGVSMNGVEITVNVEIDNPNSVGLTLDAYDYSLIVEEKNIVTGRREESVSLKANGKSILPIPIELKFGDLAAAGSSPLNDDSLPVTAALGLEVALPYVGTVRLDVSGSIEVPVIKPPILLPSGIRVESIKLSGASITVLADIKNPNGFGMVVSSLIGELSVAGQSWGQIETLQAVEVSAKNQKSVAFGISLDFGEIGRSAWNLLTGNSKLDVSMTGNMDVDFDTPAFKPGGLEWDADASVSLVR